MPKDVSVPHRIRQKVDSMNCENHSATLKSSSERVGKLYPILLDKYGNVIDGVHRLAVDSNWPKVHLTHIESERDRLIARLVGNVCRRKVTSKEKSTMLKELGKMYLEGGLVKGKISQKIADETGMSYRWVMKYLPDCLKARPGMGGPSASNFDEKHDAEQVARHSTGLDFPFVFQRKIFLSIKEYSNTDFVNITLERHFFSRIQKLSDKLGTTPQVIICEALGSMVRKLEGMPPQNTAQPIYAGSSKHFHDS